jgi:hypothetical protein
VLDDGTRAALELLVPSVALQLEGRRGGGEVEVEVNARSLQVLLAALFEPIAVGVEERP